MKGQKNMFNDGGLTEDFHNFEQEPEEVPPPPAPWGQSYYADEDNVSETEDLAVYYVDEQYDYGEDSEDEDFVFIAL
eukprot:4722433-Alexandrium_andersonii.AAC.1